MVLGNHDYIAFENVDSGVEYYKNQLSKIGIMLLHNTYKINLMNVSFMVVQDLLSMIQFGMQIV